MASQIPNINIQKNVEQFKKDKNAFSRYASFDYCFNYFQSFRENNTAELADDDHIQDSCFQLGFYLASWGMFRGSSFLLEKSIKYFEDAIRLIARYNSKIWSVDVDKYTSTNMRLLIDFKKGLKDSLAGDRKPSDTLVTKIMLGVFGNTPALDRNFRAAFGVGTFNENMLRTISDFYFQNQTEIDQTVIPTLDFMKGEETARKYTKAKIIDMVGFIEGSNLGSN